MTIVDQSKLVKAYLDVFEPSKDSLEKPGAARTPIAFQFNPKELTMTKSASWGHDKHSNNKSSGTPHFTGPEPGKLTLEMFFDASEKPDNSVKKRVDALMECCVPTKDSLSQQKGSPPWVVFRWGELSSFTGYVKSVSAKFTLFTSAGMPIRAVCTVNLEEISGQPGKTNPTSGGLLPRRVHAVQDGDTLAMLAYREYGDAALWRPLAEVNGIDDPTRLVLGAPVFLPVASELMRPRQREVARREVARARR